MANEEIVEKINRLPSPFRIVIFLVFTVIITVVVFGIIVISLALIDELTGNFLSETINFPAWQLSIGITVAVMISILNWRYTSRIYDETKRLLKSKITDESQQFLQNRKLTDVGLNDFGTYGNAGKLNYENETGDKPAVLFSSIPTILLKNISILTNEFYNEKFNTIDVQNHSIRFLHGDKTPGLEKVTYYHKNSESFDKYLEICENGFVEQGWIKPLINGPFSEKELQRKINEQMVLSYCNTMGAFNIFLQFCKNHYEHHNYKDDIIIKFSIRDANKLILKDFGGKTAKGRWSEPFDINNWSGTLPRTKEQNISISEQVSISNLTDEKIKEITHKFATKIANAYGLIEPRCYNQDNTLADEYLKHLANYSYNP